MAWKQAMYMLIIAVAVAALDGDALSTTDQWEANRIVLPLGRSVNETLGPESAVYCKLTNPSRRVVFEGHGRCRLALDRVTGDHAGNWVMDVGTAGNMLPRTYVITADVRGSGDKPTVTTYVAKEQPEVTLRCSVPVEYEVRSCLFQDPSGKVILASEGAAEDRYVYYGAGSTVNNGVTTYECGLRITNPAASDLGLWRCAVETDPEVYYGFLTVLCPWAMQDPVIAASVVSEPTLTAQQLEISHLEGDSLTLSCSIQSQIRYCYFRQPNGVTYSVSPGISSADFEYVGSGLDAGECGIRFPRLLSQETGHWPGGRWSCHVGLPDESQPEQRVNMQIQINRPIEVQQYMSERGLILEAVVHQQQTVEYCRYVRIDGLGFTTSTLPEPRYFSTEDRARGRCGLNIENPNILERHPWTIAAKLVGKEDEVLGITNHSMEIPTASAPNNNYIWLWCTTALAVVLIICAGILFIPAKNRRNTIARANSWKNSIRGSLQKKPLPDDDRNKNTPMTA